jgi:hypothetical protein
MELHHWEVFRIIPVISINPCHVPAMHRDVFGCPVDFVIAMPSLRLGISFKFVHRNAAEFL